MQRNTCKVRDLNVNAAKGRRKGNENFQAILAYKTRAFKRHEATQQGGSTLKISKNEGGANRSNRNDPKQ